ncbi:aminopeptidase [Silvanigrella aquatica]|uniref:aminopeptidase n=1 Tax=Silvanigrella aquatica TaxID=1915309 RepID=UPI000A641FCD|nr:aminopeptidase [Silvanigrella aquatica]
MKFCNILLTSFLFTGCYTLEQGVGQINLFVNQKPIDEVIQKNQEPQERLDKLKVVQPVLEYAKSEIGLTPGKSYQKYVPLKDPYVTWIVQAADKRSLNLKTWWFPIVGSQPYLGFFNKESALKEREKLLKENYDTLVGGVSAFSLLGYFPDPLYSSMLDHYTMPQFIETLIHESLHRTLYIPNYYSFNENLADFIAKKATKQYLDLHPELNQDSKKYVEEYQKNLVAQKKFQEYLVKIKIELNQFYENAKENREFKNEQIFLAEREIKFNKIAAEYKAFMNGVEIGTSYENSFQNGKINNAVILGYSIYEAKQEPLEIAFKNSGGTLKTMLKNLEVCLSSSPKDEEDLWQRVEDCQKPVSLGEHKE